MARAKHILAKFLIITLILSGVVFEFPGLGVTEPEAANAAPGDVFRVTEYFLDDDGTNDFSGTTYTLILDQDLSSDYFVIAQGSDGTGATNGGRGPDENYVSLTGDPFGTGDLSASAGNDQLDFTRNSSVNGWYGVVTVVECVEDCTTDGFTLRSAERVVHSGVTTSGTDTSATAWGDVNQVTLIGGFNGAGCDTAQAATSEHRSCHVRLSPSSTSTINWSRSATTTGFGTATSTVMAVEWGSNWTVQRVNVTGSNGGNGVNVVGEYDTAAISSVVRANTWVWGTGFTDTTGVGEGAEGSVITLGDGVTENTNETVVAVGQEYAVNKDFDVYTMTHTDLAVDYVFKADGDVAALTSDQAVAAALDGYRMAIFYNGNGAANNAWPRPMWSARYTTDTNVRLERRRSDDPFPGWLQGIDFSAIPTVTISTFEQEAYRLFANGGTTDVGSALAAQDTSATLAQSGQSFRLRMRLAATVATTPLDGAAFKLQFAQQSGTCDTGFTGETYADVSSTSTIAFYDNTTPVDGAALTGNANDPTGAGTTQNQIYIESNIFDNEQSAINSGDGGMWDFSLVDLSAPVSTAYCFRIVSYDASTLATYTVIPEITTGVVVNVAQDNYRLYENADSTDVGTPLAAQNTAGTLTSDKQAFRLRTVLPVSGGTLALSGISYKVQYATRVGTCDTSFTNEDYIDVSSTAAIAYNNKASATDGAALTSNVNDPTATGTLRDQTYVESSGFTNSQSSIASGENGLWDVSLVDNGMRPGASYCLRFVESDGTVLNSYAQIPEIAAFSGESIRSTQYYIDDFSGTTYTLTLNHDLEADYFVTIQGSDGDGSTANNRGIDENYASLTSDPNGTGDLTASGATDQIGLTRNANTDGWVGVVTVVECLRDCQNSGFDLLSVERTTHTTTATSGTDTSAAAWTDLSQVMLMGGFNGAGCDSAATTTTGHRSCHVRLYPSATDTINWTRSSVTSNFDTATTTIMVVQWGDEWSVQRVNVTGASGGNGVNIAGEYDTGAISSVTRANTWVWGTGHTDTVGVGEGGEGVLITLGDGVSQNASETTVAIGSEYTANKDFEVYVMEHPDMAVDYRFKPDGSDTSLTYSQTVDMVTDNALAQVTNGVNGAGNQYPRPIFSARHTDSTTVQLERRRSGANFPAWVQSVDFDLILPPVFEHEAYRLFANTDSTDVGAALAASDTSATLSALGEAFRLRVALGLTEAQVQQSGIDLKLQFATQSGTCDTSFTGETYADVTAATAIAYSVNTTPADGATATANANDPTATGVKIMQTYEELNNATNSVTAIGNGNHGLFDFSLIDFAQTPTTTYCLRLVKSDNNTLDTYTIIPEITTNAGTLVVDIVDGAGASVASPSVAMTSTPFSFSTQTPTGTFGTTTERIRVTNTTAGSEWSLTLAASSGNTAVWTGSGSTYDFNDPTASAGDGGDGDTVGGQMTVDPSVGTITPQGGCNSTGITAGSSAAFNEGVLDSVTLLTAAATAQTGCYWDFTDAAVSQSVPAEQPADTYAIDVTLTVTAI